MEINKVSASDLPRIMEIQKKYFHNATFYELKDLSEKANNKDVIFIKLVDKSQILGYLLAYQLVDHIDIYQIVIDEQYQHQGYASLLLKELEKKQLPIFVEVSIKNDKGVRFYQTHHFKTIKVLHNYYASSDGYLMSKEPMENTTQNQSTNQPKKQPKESWESFNKKIFFDKTYRFHITWWPMFAVLVLIVVTFLVISLVATIKLYAFSGTSWPTSFKTLVLVDGYLIIFLTAIYWICNNFLNSSIDKTKVHDDQLKHRVKKSNIALNTVRICLLLSAVVCGLLDLTAGYGMGELADNTVMILMLLSTIFYFILGTASAVFYPLFFTLKNKILNEVIVKEI